MPKERTEEQMLSRAPLELQFGGKECKVPVLTVMKARAWREKLAEEMRSIGAAGISIAGLATAFLAFPEKVADLVVAYAPEVVPSDVLDVATEEEMLLAFSQMVHVSFPYLRLLSLMKSISQATPGTAIAGASENSMKSFSPNTDSRQIM